MARKLSDERIKAEVLWQLQNAAGWSGGDVSDERSAAMDYYLGELYGTEVKGRSQLVTREVLDTVETVMPSLMRIFMDPSNLAVWEPMGPEDEEAAEQESDVCSHVFWQQNRGYHNLYTTAKDGLLSKTGILKIWWDDKPTVEREEYKGLTDIELAQLLTDQTIERQVLEFDQDEAGYSIAFETTKRYGCVRIEACPPEEFGVNKQHRGLLLSDAGFCYHKTRKTRSELIAAGYNRKLVESLPSEDVPTSQEQLSRRNLSDETEEDYAHESNAAVWVAECYTRMDRNNDGIAELLKVTLATGAGNDDGSATLLEVEEVDRVPFAAWSPVPLTHKFYGLSLADLVMDLQIQKSTLLRGIVDNMNLANNQRTAANERVNLQDLLTSVPGGVVRVEGMDPPQNSVSPLVTPPVPPQVYDLLQYLDEERKDRTGVSDMVAALDTNSLSNINTGVAAMAFDSARARLELIARNMGEYLVRPAWEMIHELLRKHSTHEMTVRLRNRWTQVRPQAWRERTDLRLQVGLGRASRERRVVALESVLQKQVAALQFGGMGTVLTPQHLHKALADYTEALGETPELYWADPQTLPPQQPQPDPKLMIEQGKLQMDGARLQLEARRTAIEERKAELQAQIQMTEVAGRQREAELKAQMEQLKSQMSFQKQMVDERSQVLNATTEARAREADVELRRVELSLKQHQANTQAQLEEYKANLSAMTTLQSKVLEVESRAVQAERQAQQVEGQRKAESVDSNAVIAELREEVKKLRAPKKVQRGADGRIVAIGEQMVRYGDDGLVEGIG